jgi:two-component system cell cycle sensor histidine kinase/response regulator CckA
LETNNNAPRPGNGRHILYVDDETALVEIANRTLRRMGYRVSSFVKPLEALAAFRDEPHSFDLMVTDLNMPGYSGMELVREVLKLRAELPVILNSGGLTPALTREALHLGVREVVDKPATMHDLCEVIHRLIGGILNPSR